jgi:hypothetical protein
MCARLGGIALADDDAVGQSRLPAGFGHLLEIARAGDGVDDANQRLQMELAAERPIAGKGLQHRSGSAGPRPLFRRKASLSIRARLEGAARRRGSRRIVTCSENRLHAIFCVARFERHYISGRCADTREPPRTDLLDQTRVITDTPSFGAADQAIGKAVQPAHRYAVSGGGGVINESLHQPQPL